MWLFPGGFSRASRNNVNWAQYVEFRKSPQHLVSKPSTLSFMLIREVFLTIANVSLQSSKGSEALLVCMSQKHIFGTDAISSFSL